MNAELRSAVLEMAAEYNWAPEDILTIYSYETGGTFDPWKRGPTTQWGEHRGLIQWGEPQRKKYGVTQETPIRDQVFATAKYWIDHGAKPGDGLLPLYAAVNAGDARKFNVTDENNGGAPGTVREKVNNQMHGHRRNAQALLGDSFKAINRSSDGGITPQYEGGQGTALNRHFAMSPMTYEPVAPEEFDKEDPSFFQLALDAAQSQSTIAALSRLNPSLAPDPDYRLDEQKIKDLLGPDLDPENYAGWFASARSEAHAVSIREAALRNEERKERLGRGGWTGVGLQMAAELLDPVALGAEMLTLGLAAPLTRSIQGGRILSAGRYALLGGAAGAAGAAATVPIVPERDGWDVVQGAIFGAGLGGVVGSLIGNPRMGLEAQNLQRIQKNLQDGLAPDNAGSVGAAASTVRHDRYLDDALGKIQDNEVARTFAAAIRFDNMGILMRSKNPVVRLFSKGLAKDAAEGGAMTVTEETQKFFDIWSRDYFSTWGPASKQFLERKGVRAWEYRKKREAITEFHEEIGRYIRDRAPTAERYTAEVKRVGDKIRQLQNDIRKLANNPRAMEGLSARAVSGFEELAENPHYLNRVWDAKKVADARRLYGDSGLENAIEYAMRAVNDNVPPNLQRKAAAAMARAIRDRAHGLDSDIMRKLSGDDLEDIGDILQQYGGLSRSEVESLLQSYKRKPKDKAPARGKSRVFLDETVEFDLPRADGTGADRTSIQELLLVNDANFLVGRYMRQMSGRVALARYKVLDPKTEEALVDGITNDGEWATLMDKVRKAAADRGLSGNATDREIERMQHLYDYAVGRPLNKIDGTTAGDAIRVIEGFNYARVMNQAGFAQLPELAGVISAAGWKAMLSHMPALRRMVSPSGDTRLVNEFAHDLEEFIAYGTDRLRRSDYMRMDDMSGSPFNQDRGGWLNSAQNVTNSLSRVTSDISGMNIVNMGLQRIAATSMTQRFVDMAHGGKKMATVRLRSLGLDEKMAERVFKQLRDPKNVETVKGSLTNRKIKKMNFDNWDDLEAREAFRDTLFMATRQMIQTNDIGMMSKWMSHPVGRLIVQFRRFIAGSFTNNLLYNLNMLKGGDASALSFFLLSTLMSGAAYAARMQIVSLGRSDREEYLADRLSAKNLALASFERSGYSSILPMLFDSTVSKPLTGGMVFDFRTTGQPQDVLLGNPTAGFLGNDLQEAISGVTHPLMNGRGMTKQDADAIVRVLPFANSIPVVLLLNGLANATGMEPRRPRDDFR